MDSNQIFNALFSGGKISRHWLVEFHYGTRHVYLINNNEAVTYAGQLYSASTFEYTQPNNKGDGGGLTITSFDNDLIELVDNMDDSYSMRVVGLLAEDSQNVTPINVFKHFYGSVTIGTDGNINFTLGKDDRLNMKFCVKKYDTETNPGNA